MILFATGSKVVTPKLKKLWALCPNLSLSLVYYGGPPTAMNAVLAIIADGGRAIVAIDREAVEINYFLV